MGLKDQQRTLAKLFTLDSARSDFLSDNEVLKEYAVSIKDSDLTKDQFSMQIYEFADSLIKKRLGQVRQHIPGTCYIVKTKLAEMFQEYAKDEPTSGIKRHLYDSLMFMKYLELNYPEFLISNIYKSIFKFEKIRLKAILANRFLYIKIFPFEVSVALEKLKLYDQKSNVSLGSPRICFWIKASADKDVVYRELYPRFWPVMLTKELRYNN